jgi:tRNA(fMet)-specific endonuclease VapC
MRYLVDTDWLIDTLIGLPPAVTTLERLVPAGIGISIISIGEIYEGAFRGSEPATALARYRTFLAPLPALSLSDAIMEHFARIRARLRQDGNLIPDLDLLIASTAIQHDLILLSRNRRHFDRIPGLKLYESG